AHRATTSQLPPAYTFDRLGALSFGERGSRKACSHSSLARKEREERHMGLRLFVGNLSFNTDENALRDAFGAHGAVTDVTVITDRETGRSRGFGFVTMADANGM